MERHGRGIVDSGLELGVVVAGRSKTVAVAA